MTRLTSPQIPQWVGAVFLAGLLAPALATNGMNSPLGAACASFGCLALFAWFAFRREALLSALLKRASTPLTLFVAALLFLLVSVLSRPAWFSSGIAAAWLQAASLGAICITGAIIGSDRRLARSLVFALAVFGIGYALVSLSLWQFRGQVDPSLPDGWDLSRFSGTLRNPNAAGCLFGMFGILVLGSLFMPVPGRKAQAVQVFKGIWLGIGFVLLIAACGLTGSRASTAISLMTAGALTGLFLLRKRLIGRMKIFAMGALVAGVAIVGVAGSATLGQRGKVIDAAQGRLSGAAAYWDLSWTHPVFGMGPGAFRQINEAALNPDNVETLWNWGAAHSALLQAALEGGWPYALLSLAAIVLVASSALRWGLKSREPVGLAALGVFVIAAACGSVDIAMNVPAISSLAFFCLGLSWGRGSGLGVSAQTPSGRRAIALRKRSSLSRRSRRASAAAGAGERKPASI